MEIDCQYLQELIETENAQETITNLKKEVSRRILNGGLVLLNLDSKSSRASHDLRKDPQLELLFGNCLFEHNLLRLDLLRERFKYDESGFGGRHYVGGKPQIRKISKQFGVLLFCEAQVEIHWSPVQVKHFLAKRLAHVTNLTYSDIIVLS